MKIIFAAAALSFLGLAAAPAMAQSTDEVRPFSGYASLGYARVDPSNTGGLGEVNGRLGARFGSYLGLEGEGGFGVGSDKGTVSGVPFRNSLKHQFAAYAVGYYPVTPRFDLFIRGGYGTTKTGAEINGVKTELSRDSWNYGGGAQYFFTGADGVRVDYTREDFRNGAGNANVWGASYVRKF